MRGGQRIREKCIKISNFKFLKMHMLLRVCVCCKLTCRRFKTKTTMFLNVMYSLKKRLTRQITNIYFEREKRQTDKQKRSYRYCIGFIVVVSFFNFLTFY